MRNQFIILATIGSILFSCAGSSTEEITTKKLDNEPQITKSQNVVKERGKISKSVRSFDVADVYELSINDSTYTILETEFIIKDGILYYALDSVEYIHKGDFNLKKIKESGSIDYTITRETL